MLPTCLAAIISLNPLHWLPGATVRRCSTDRSEYCIANRGHCHPMTRPLSSVQEHAASSSFAAGPGPATQCRIHCRPCRSSAQRPFPTNAQSAVLRAGQRAAAIATQCIVRYCLCCSGEPWPHPPNAGFVVVRAAAATLGPPHLMQRPLLFVLQQRAMVCAKV